MIITIPIIGTGNKDNRFYSIRCNSFSSNVALGTTLEDEPEVESDGGLAATLNGESFRRGDTIIISGTVEEREREREKKKS